eukprot:s223_g42.t1
MNFPLWQDGSVGEEVWMGDPRRGRWGNEGARPSSSPSSPVEELDTREVTPIEEKDYYNQKARAPGSADFFFISYAWEPPSQSDPRRGATITATGN